MRIAMVSEHASPLATIGDVDAGGQNVYVAGLSRALAVRGHTVDVFTRRDDPDLPERVELASGVTVVHVPAGPAQVLPKDELLPLMPDFGRWMAKAWMQDQWTARHPVDVAHAHFWMSGLALREAARGVKHRTGQGIRSVQTFHALGSVKRRMQGSDDTSPECRVGAESDLARSADRLIATCTDEVRELMEMGAPAASIDIVPCGVDLDHFRSFGPLMLPPGVPAIPDGHHRLLCVGRLVERKGVASVIHALAALPQTHLVIAGGPAAADLGTDPEATRLRQLAGQLGVADRIHLLGQVSRAHLPSLLRWADILVATPWYEPFGMVPLEAMACGRPVVASAVGGLLDTVVHGSTGLFVPPHDPGQLARTLRDLLADPDRRAAMGQAGHARARTRYGWDRVAQDVETAYTALLPALPVLTMEAM